jgi:hypothetical protein
VYYLPHIRNLALQLGLLAAVPVLAWPQGTSACDFVAPYGTVDVADVQAIINMTLGISPCTVNIGGSGVCNAAVVQRVINAALGGTCLTGFGAVAHYATLNWTASTSTGISGYNVYRATTPTAALANGLYTKLNSSPVVGTTYIDTSVSAGVTYYYATTAVSNAGVESATSNQFQAPAIPTP